MKVIHSVELDAEERAALKKVVPLLDVYDKIIDDKYAMRRPQTLHQIADAIAAATAQQRQHHQLWSAHGADLERRNAALMKPGAADHMVALTTGNLTALARAATIINQAINLTTPEDPDTI